MIYLGIKYYLRKNFSKPSIGFQWTKEKNDELFSYIKDNFSFDELAKSKNRLEIKQAFIDFFEPVGYILFRMKDDNINLRVFTYKTEPKNSQYLESLIKLIISNEEKIIFDYKGREDQIVIEGKFRREIFNFVKNIEDEQINRKELIRYAVKKALELDTNDVVMIKKKQVFIKVFKNTKRHETVENKSVAANRYNGFEEDELKELYKEYFSNEKIESFLQLIAKEYFEEFLFNREINNKYYEKTVFSTVQTIITEELLEFINENGDFRKGFAGYIFRINFIPFFQLLADLILENIFLRNDFILNWLKYYDGAIFVDGGKRYTSPELITPDGKKWNPIAIHGNVLTWFKTKEKIVMFKKLLIDEETRLESLRIKGKSPSEHKKDLYSEITELEKIIHKINDDIKDKVEEKYATKDEKKLLQISKTTSLLRKDLENVQGEIDTVKNSINLIRTENEYKKIEQTKSKHLSDIKREERILSESQQTYESIQLAVAKALTSKRKAI